MNSDSKSCISSGNCLCFVLERKRGSVPSERPVLCLLGKRTADKDCLTYPHPGFLRQDEVYKPSTVWQQMTCVIYSHVLPQPVCMFARDAVQPRWPIVTVHVLFSSSPHCYGHRISKMLWFCSDLTDGLQEILCPVWHKTVHSPQMPLKILARKREYLWVWPLPVSTKMQTKIAPKKKKILKNYNFFPAKPFLLLKWWNILER